MLLQLYTCICLYLQVNRYCVSCGCVPDYGYDAYNRTSIHSRWHQTSHPSPVVATVCHAEDTRDGLLELHVLRLIVLNAL